MKVWLSLYSGELNGKYISQTRQKCQVQLFSAPRNPPIQFFSFPHVCSAACPAQQSKPESRKTSIMLEKFRKSVELWEIQKSTGKKKKRRGGKVVRNKEYEEERDEEEEAEWKRKAGDLLNQSHT